eukprot:1186533-Prorocentrum_minimum.AAC.1
MLRSFDETFFPRRSPSPTRTPSHNGPIRRRIQRYILTMDQSGAGYGGIFTGSVLGRYGAFQLGGGSCVQLLYHGDANLHMHSAHVTKRVTQVHKHRPCLLSLGRICGKSKHNNNNDVCMRVRSGTNWQTGKLANSEDDDKQTPSHTSYLGRTYLSKLIVCSFITSPDVDLACKRKGGVSVVSFPWPVETVNMYTRKSVVLRNPCRVLRVDESK